LLSIQDFKTENNSAVLARPIARLVEIPDSSQFLEFVCPERRYDLTVSRAPPQLLLDVAGFQFNELDLPVTCRLHMHF